MKSKSELIFEDNAWMMILSWIQESKIDVTVLDNERDTGEEVLFQLQVTNKSTLGAIASETGGMLVDNGWLKILGSGHSQIYGSLNVNHESFPFNEGFVVAYDVVGGVFAINSEYFDKNSRNVYYFAPDTLEWEDTGKGYTDFIYWLFHGDLNSYYEYFRWKGWREDIKKLREDQGISIYPYLWTEEGKNIEACHKEAIPFKEIWGIQNQFKSRING